MAIKFNNKSRLLIGFVIFMLYVVIGRRFEKKQILSWEFRGVVEKVKFYRGNNIVVVINGKEYKLLRYGLHIKIYDGYMEDGDGDDVYKHTCIINPGDSLIKKKGQWPILLVKNKTDKIDLKCEFDDPIWFYQYF